MCILFVLRFSLHMKPFYLELHSKLIDNQSRQNDIAYSEFGFIGWCVSFKLLAMSNL